MSTATLAEPAVRARFWDRQRRLGTALVLLGVLAAAVFGALAPSETARFTLSEDAEGAALSIDGKLGAILFGLLALAAGVALLTGKVRRRQTLLLGAGMPK